MNAGQIKCLNCGGTLQLSANGKEKNCPYCDSVFQIEEKTGDFDSRCIAGGQESACETSRNFSEIVRNICGRCGFDSVYGKAGYSLENYGKYLKAKQYFAIGADEDIYLIFDATILGSCKKGFAVCTTGLYYCADGHNAYVISWNQFKSVEIRKKAGNIFIGNAEFNAGTDSGKLYKIFMDIQNAL